MTNINNKEDYKEAFRGTLILTFSIIVLKLIGFIYKLPLSYILGDEGMGFFNSAYTVFGFFYMICTGGIPRAISIIVARENNKFNVEKMLNYALAFFAFCGFIFSFFMLVFARAFANFIGNDLARFSLACIAPSLTFISAAGVLRGYFHGKSKFGFIAVSEMIEGFIKFILGLALAIYASRKNYSAPIISAYTVLGVTLGAFFSSLFLFVCSKSSKNDDKARQNNDNSLSFVRVIKGIFIIAFPITISSFVSGLYNIADLFLILKGLIFNGFTKDESMAIYGNYSTLVVPMLTLVSALLAPLSTSYLPKLARCSRDRRSKDFSETFLSLFSLTAGASIVIACVFFVFSKDILIILFKEESAFIGYKNLSLLAPALIFLPLLTTVNIALESSKRVKYPLIATAFGLILKILSEMSMFLFTEINISSAPISTVIGYCGALFLSIVFLVKNTGVKLYVFNSLFLPFIISASSFIISKCFFERIFKDYYVLWELVSAVFFGCAIFIVACYLLRCKFIYYALNFVGIHKKEE